jgi:hypothetical protein
LVAYSRRVRRLTVRAPNDTVARQTAVRLEDALGTASLPGGDDARVVVIRTLRLGRIPSDASSAQLALAVEQRLWQLGASAVHALQTGAADAGIVYFRDAAEAHALLASRLAAGVAPTEWFWRVAVPAWTADRSRDDALRDVLEAIASQAAAPLIAAEVIRHVSSSGAGDVLCAAIHREDAARWLAVYPWKFVAAAATGPVQVDRVTVALERLLDRWVAAWGGDDPRSLWLAAVSLIASHAASAGDTRLRTRAEALVRSRTWQPRSDDRSSPQPSGDQRQDDLDASIARRIPGGQQPSPPQPDDAHAAPGPTRADVIGQFAATRAAELSDRGEAPLIPRVSSPWEMTHAGGLLFLLQPLARLGMAELLASQPHLVRCDIATRVLAAVAERVDVRREDPVWRLLSAMSLHPSDSTLDDATADTNSVGSVVQKWVGDVRRWSRMVARIGLWDIVRRDARLAVTDIHVDVRFDLRQSDVRVRRAGLDVDPGWVPWFGRVVRFHYGVGVTHE